MPIPLLTRLLKARRLSVQADYRYLRATILHGWGSEPAMQAKRLGARLNAEAEGLARECGF